MAKRKRFAANLGLKFLQGFMQAKMQSSQRSAQIAEQENRMRLGQQLTQENMRLGNELSQGNMRLSDELGTKRDEAHTKQTEELRKQARKEMLDYEREKMLSDSRRRGDAAIQALKALNTESATQAAKRIVEGRNKDFGDEAYGPYAEKVLDHYSRLAMVENKPVAAPQDKEIAGPDGKTHYMGWNPKTIAYDIDLGIKPEKPEKDTSEKDAASLADAVVKDISDETVVVPGKPVSWGKDIPPVLWPDASPEQRDAHIQEMINRKLKIRDMAKQAMGATKQATTSSPAPIAQPKPQMSEAQIVKVVETLKANARAGDLKAQAYLKSKGESW